MNKWILHIWDFLPQFTTYLLHISFETTTFLLHLCSNIGYNKMNIISSWICRVVVDTARTQVTLHWTVDTSPHPHNNHHAHYSISFTVSVASISRRKLELSVVSTRHVSGVSCQWPVSTIGRNNTDPESINRDTTNTHWPLDIPIIHLLAILWQKYHLFMNIIISPCVTTSISDFNKPNIWEGSRRKEISM